MKRRAFVRSARALAAVALLALAAYELRFFEPLPLEAAASSSRLVLGRDGHLLRAFTTPDGRWRLDAKPEEVSATYIALLLTSKTGGSGSTPAWTPGRSAALCCKQCGTAGSSLAAQR